MLTQCNNAARTAFSWRRLGEFAAYHAPMAKKQLLVYFLVSLAFAVLTLLPLPEYVQVGFFTIIWTAIPIMFELGPVALAKNGDSGIIERLIPVTAAEKFTYYILYFTLAIGAATYLLPTIALQLYKCMPGVQTQMMLKMVELKFLNPPVVVTSNVLSLLAAAMTCLLVVKKARTSRVVKGVMSAFAVQVVVGMLGAIGGMTAAFSMGVRDGVNGNPLNSDDNIRSLVREVLAGPYIYVTTALLAVYIIAVLCMFYRNLKKSNI